MPQPTIQEIFGDSAVQDANTLTITKADFANLTPSADNSGEALFTAIYIQAQTKLNATNQTEDQDIDIVTTKVSQASVTRNGNNYIRHSFTTTFDVPDETSLVRPDAFEAQD